LPSGTRPDVPVDPPTADPDDVVEVFHGDTLEEAMAAAVADLGPDLLVRRARKVRSGMRGLMGKDRYEVLAAPPPGRAPAHDGADAVSAALEALVDRADAEDAADVASPPSSTAPGAPRDGEVVAEPAEARAARSGRASQAPPAPRGAEDEPTAPALARADERSLAAVSEHPDPAVAEHPVVVDLDAAPPWPPGDPATVPGGAEAGRDDAPPAQDAPEPATGPAAAQATGWSVARLQEVGVPSEVLAALPEDLPSEADDLGWVGALAGAIAATVPGPAAADAEHPAVVDGHGVAGALAQLGAGVRGVPPGTLTTAGRTVPATAVELALAVRTAVLP
jgi:hypothetical protein